MLFNMLHQAVCILAHFKEISFLFRIHNRAATVRTAAVHKLRFRPEGLTGRAVFALVAAFINVALLIQALENLLHLFHMHGIRGADKSIICRIHQIPNRTDLPRDTVDILLRGNAGRFRLVLNFLSMLVGTGLEVDVVTGHTLVAGNGVRQHNLVGVANVRFRRSIRDRSRYIVRFFVHRLRLLSQ